MIVNHQAAETPTSEHLLHLEIVKAVETFTVSPVTSSALVPTPFVHREKPPPSVHGETLPTSNSATAAVAATAATTFSRTTFGKLATHPKVVFDRGKSYGDLFIHATRHFPYDRGKLFVFWYFSCVTNDNDILNVSKNVSKDIKIGVHLCIDKTCFSVFVGLMKCPPADKLTCS